MPPKIPRTWNKQDKELIEVVKKYNLEHDFDVKQTETSLQNEIWLAISKRVNMQVHLCRKKWLKILHHYLKLKHMIYIGRVTEDTVKKHIRTSRYLDGRLDFLDRYMTELPDAKLSASAHGFFKSVFRPSTSRNSVDMGKLIKVKENNVLEVITDFQENTGTEPTSILPNIEHYESEAFVKLETDQTIQDQNNIVEKQEDVELQHLPSFCGKRREKKRNTEDDGDLARFIIKHGNMEIENNARCDSREYMYDFAELLCGRLEPEKRKYFLSQIDLLVSEILEEK